MENDGANFIFKQVKNQKLGASGIKNVPISKRCSNILLLTSLKQISEWRADFWVGFTNKDKFPVEGGFIDEMGKNISIKIISFVQSVHTYCFRV